MNAIRVKIFRSLGTIIVAVAGSYSAADTVVTAKGSLSGSITSIGRYEVVLKRSNDTVETIPVGRINSLRFEGEPAQLNLARTTAENGRYEEALKSLDKLAQEKYERPEIAIDLAYYRAYCAARLALSGQGDLREAGRSLGDFLKNHPETYHFLAATELLGDLLVGVKAYGKAVEQYAVLEAAPFPETQLRGALARGRALHAQGKLDEAEAAFTAALAKTEGSEEPSVVAARHEALLGKAEILAAGGKYEDAIGQVEAVIASADPENAKLLARAYNALGSCHRQGSQPKAALLAYLHTDVLYFSQTESHAEALSNLAQLWNELREPQRAAEAQQMLKERYPGSPWAK